MRFKYLGAAALVLAACTSISAAIALAMPAGRSVAIIGPSADGVRAVAAADGLILRADRLIVIARSNDRDFVRRLYAAGALLVLDAEDAGGCSGRAAPTAAL